MVGYWEIVIVMDETKLLIRYLIIHKNILANFSFSNELKIPGKIKPMCQIKNIQNKILLLLTGKYALKTS